MQKSNLLATMLMILGIVAVSVEAVTLVVSHVAKLNLSEADYELDMSVEDDVGMVD